MVRKGNTGQSETSSTEEIPSTYLEANKLNPYGPLRRHFWFKPYIDLVCWEETDLR